MVSRGKGRNANALSLQRPEYLFAQNRYRGTSSHSDYGEVDVKNDYNDYIGA